MNIPLEMWALSLVLSRLLQCLNQKLARITGGALLGLAAYPDQSITVLSGLMLYFFSSPLSYWPCHSPQGGLGHSQTTDSIDVHHLAQGGYLLPHYHMGTEMVPHLC